MEYEGLNSQNRFTGTLCKYFARCRNPVPSACFLTGWLRGRWRQETAIDATAEADFEAGKKTRSPGLAPPQGNMGSPPRGPPKANCAKTQGDLGLHVNWLGSRSLT